MVHGMQKDAVMEDRPEYSAKLFLKAAASTYNH